MKLHRKTIILNTILVLALLALAVGVVFFFHRLRYSGPNLTEVFVSAIDEQPITCFQLPQIQDLYDITPPPKGHYRSYNPCVFDMPSSITKYHELIDLNKKELNHWCVYRLSNFTTCKGAMPQLWYRQKGNVLNSTFIRAPSGALFQIDYPHQAGPTCPQGIEDMRAIVNKNSLFLIGNEASGSACRRRMVMFEMPLDKLQVKGKHAKPHLLSLVDRFKLEAEFGHERDQKNWMPFLVDHELHFVYSINPHVILKWQKDGPCVKVAETKNKKLPDNLRGGSQVIEVRKSHSNLPAEDLYLAVVHTRDRVHEYSTYFYAFERKYPYAVKHITKGFVIDQNKSKTKRIQFAAGLARSLRQDSHYLEVSYGEHDCTSNMFVIKEEDVLRSLQSV